MKFIPDAIENYPHKAGLPVYDVPGVVTVLGKELELKMGTTMPSDSDYGDYLFAYALGSNNDDDSVGLCLGIAARVFSTDTDGEGYYLPAPDHQLKLSVSILLPGPERYDEVVSKIYKTSALKQVMIDEVITDAVPLVRARLMSWFASALDSAGLNVT